MEDKKLLGEWSDTINAFWFGANNCEWIAWKGSHQVFVYPCDEHPNPPSQIIQHSNRIESLEDFTEAIYNGNLYEPEYKQVKKHWEN
ncbi:hypothetical protein [Siminovitchia sp. 179-K 8D1 HS]|uniref:hypothetical protein n=1 Tax=Siminovitchia sp. 179-K 8D1 HS TaxID=3142385 RepID=UPI0039A2021C